MGILSKVGDITSPVGDNIHIQGLKIYDSSKAEFENKSPIPVWIKVSQSGDLKYPIGDIIPNGIFSSVSPLVVPILLYVVAR